MDPTLAALAVADDADLWRRLGFEVDGATAVVSGVDHLLGAGGKGISAWAFRDTDDDVDGIDGVPFTLPVRAAAATPDHPNGVASPDHLVLSSPDLDRTVKAFEAAGIPLRRTRDTGTEERPMRQAFFKVGEVILELVGPRLAMGDGPLRFFGLAWTCHDLDATAAFYGDLLHPAKDAVQPGRRIATRRHKDLDLSVAIAFMSPGAASA